MNQIKFLWLLVGIMLTAICAISLPVGIIAGDVGEVVLDILGVIVGVWLVRDSTKRE